jgi:hypothetical protein
MPRRHNGGIIGVLNSTTVASAKGRFSFNEVLEALKGNNWPKGEYNIQYLVIAGGGSGAGNGANGNQRGGGGGAGGYRSSISGESSGGGASAESPVAFLVC